MKRELSTSIKTGRPRRKSERENGNEVQFLDVYECADDYHPLISTSGAKKERLGRLTFSENFLKDSARRWGGGRWMYFVPVDGSGNWIPETSGKKAQAHYVPKVVDTSSDDDNLKDAQRNGSHSSLGEITEAMKLVREIEREAAATRKPLVEELREAKEINEFLNPHREVNPAPSHTSNVDMELLKAMTPHLVSEDAAIRDRAADMIERLSAKALKDELSVGEAIVEVGKEFVKSGQGPALIQAAFTGLGNLFSMFGRGPAQQAQTQPPQPPQAPRHQEQQAPPAQQTQQQPQTPQPQEQPQTVEDQALNIVVEGCRHEQPITVVFDRLMNFADAVNEQAPQYSIDGYIEMLAVNSTDSVVEFLKTLPGGAQVAELPHTRSWCARLQEKIKASGFLDDDAGGEFDQVTEVNGGHVKL